MIELEFIFGPDDDLFRISLIPDSLLPDAIMLFQTAHEYVAKVKEANSLPTVKHNGVTYYADLQLGEFRNVDDPDDRIAMERPS